MKLLLLAVLTAGLALAADAAHAATVAVHDRTLVVTGDRTGEKLVLRARARGLVIAGRAVARRRFGRVLVRAGGGDDVVRVDRSARRLRVTFAGGRGDDTLLGGRGADRLIGGDGDDLVDGGRGDDTVRLGAGDDRLRWHAGDDSVEGGAGSDTLIATGSRAADAFRLSPHGVLARLSFGRAVVTLGTLEHTDLRTLGGADSVTTDDLTGTPLTGASADLGGADGASDRVVVTGTPGDDAIDVSGTTVAGVPVPLTLAGTEAGDRLEVRALAGFDRIASAGLAAGALALTADGGPDDDALAGGPAAEVLVGGDGNDAVDGNQGDDRAVLGAGDDRFTWDAGDGSDVVEGQDGLDTMAYNGSGAAERIAVAAAGPRVRLTRDVGSVAMDIDDVERIETAAVGGGDTLTAGTLAGTDVTALRFGVGTDGAGDHVFVEGSSGADAIAVSGLPGSTILTSAGMRLEILGARAPDDALHVNGLDGDDAIDASALTADAIRLDLHAGAGADTVRGGSGPDTVLLGAGDDRFTWNAGDDGDDVEGESGLDTMTFNGSSAAEVFELAADGAGVRFTRDIGGVAMRLGAVERIDVAPLGGADRLTAGDLTATGLTTLNVALGSDGAIDDVFAIGSAGDDVALVTGAAGSATLTGLSATVAISGAEVPDDRLAVRLVGGDDTIDATGLAADAIGFAADGGDGHDSLRGGAGADILRGGAGDDRLHGGPGADDLDGGAGNNTVVQD